MFSYLRPHRRTPSNSASSIPDQATWENPLAASAIAERTSSVNPSSRPFYVKRYTSPTASTAPLSLPITTSGLDPHPDYQAESSEGIAERDMKLQWMGTQIEQRMQNISLNDSPHHMQQNGRPTSEGTGSDAVRAASLTVDTSFATIDDPKNARAAGRRPTNPRLQTSPPATSMPTLSAPIAAEPAPSRSTKARRTLLKPMSLLTRRRTSHQLDSSSPVLSSPRLDSTPLSTNDLSIRGTVVHDFSAPRPKRNTSYTDVTALPIKGKESAYHHSPANGESGSWNHTPAFTEDFDEQQYPAAGPHVRRASDLSDLHSPTPQYAKDVRRSPEHNRSYSQSPDENRKGEFVKPSSSPGPPVPQQLHASSEYIAQALPDSIQATPDTTPEKHNNRSRNVSAASISGSNFLGIPRHKSTSSRFSFDMVGAANQEKLLEDGYRRREAEKRTTNPPENGHTDYDNEGEEDEFDYDAMMDDDGLEEMIPGVNSDLYTEEDDVPLQSNMTGLTFHPMTASTMTLNTSSLHASIPSETPRNSGGDVIGFAFSKDSPETLSQVHSNGTLDSPMSPESREMLAKFEATFDGPVGLGLHGIDVDNSDDEFGPALKPRSESILSLTPAASFPHPGDLDDDDLYFDDGIIAQEGEGIDGSTFDESMFDREDTDQYGRPLKDLPPLQASNVDTKSPLAPEEQENISKEVQEEAGGLAPQPSLCFPQRPSLGLTHDTLAAYQDALAQAAQKAFDSGKFNRRSSDPPVLSPHKSADDEQLFSPDYEFDDFAQDDFDYDDRLEDDPIIAAANAEALANDPEGFYGQEFGFYSAPLPAAGDVEYAIGGYFGPRGIEGLSRSQSSRVPYGFREPNLTPITERSEYSARNSVMSNLNAFGSFRDSTLSTPGLAQLQLAGLMSPFDDEDLSLSRLMKARRGAWGGSQASASSENGSPISGHASPKASGHARNDSALSGSAWSGHESDESPRVSMFQEKKHKRGGSADSVSYVRDEERWVLERRRTGEDGGVEILGREVIVGGRI